MRHDPIPLTHGVTLEQLQELAAGGHCSTNPGDGHEHTAPCHKAHRRFYARGIDRHRVRNAASSEAYAAICADTDRGAAMIQRVGICPACAASSFDEAIGRCQSRQTMEGDYTCEGDAFGLEDVWLEREYAEAEE